MDADEEEGHLDENGNEKSKRKHSEVQADEAPKKKKYLQSFKQSYAVLWPCLRQSNKAEHIVHCTVCKTDFSCGHAGKFDCQRHVNNKQHKDLSKLKENNTSMTSFVNPTNFELNRRRSITRAEVMMTELITELNLPLSSADTFNTAFKIMFPDSKIAEGMKCARNKATAIVLDLAKMNQKTLSERLKSGPFSISPDGSNDTTSKQYPLVVRTKDRDTGLIHSELLSIPMHGGSNWPEYI